MHDLIRANALAVAVPGDCCSNGAYVTHKTQNPLSHTRRLPKLDVSNLQKLLTLCAACSKDAMTEDHLARRHNVKVVYLVDFDQIHRLLSPWYSAHTSPNDLASYPVVSQVFSYPDVAYFLSPGCIAEMSGFLSQLRTGTSALADSIQATDAAAAKEALQSFFYLSGSSHAAVPDNPTLLKEANSLARAHSAALTTIERLSVGVSKLRALLLHNCAPMIRQALANSDFALSSEMLEKNIATIQAYPSRGARTHNNRVDAHNICLADALNQFFSGAYSRDRDSVVYFTKVLTDTPTLYKAKGALQLELSYSSYFEQSVDLLEPAERLLLKRRLKHLIDDHRVEDVEELFQSSTTALTSLELTRWKLDRTDAPLNAIVYELLPGYSGQRHDPRLRQHLNHLNRFAWALRRSIAEEIILLNERAERRLIDETPAYPVAAPDMCDSLVQNILELQRIVNAADKYGFHETALQRNPKLVLEGDSDVYLTDCGFIIDIDPRTDCFQARLLAEASIDNVAKQPDPIVCITATRHSTVVWWPRSADIRTDLLRVLTCYERFAGGHTAYKYAAQLLSENLEEGTIVDHQQAIALAKRSFWVRLLCHDVDIHVEIASRKDALPRLGVILGDSDPKALALACDLFLESAPLWIPAKPFRDQFWGAAAKGVSDLTGRMRPDEH